MVTYTFTNGTVADADEVNQNFIDAEEIAMVGVAQNAYQTLQANNIFDNKDFLAAEEFTDITGTNNTVNTGSSTALFATDKYILGVIGDAGDHVDADGFTLSSSGAVTTSNGYRILIGASSVVITTVTKNSACTGTRCRIFTDAGVLIETATFSGDVATMSGTYLYVTGTYYRVEVDASGGSYTRRYLSSPGFPTAGTKITYSTGSIDQVNNSAAYNIDSITTQDFEYSSPKTVVCDTTTLTLDGTENAICVYGDVDLPTNTSMTVDVSDGTTTVSAQPINTLIDISSLSSGTLKLTFNLVTTDTAVTPSFYGWGVYKI